MNPQSQKTNDDPEISFLQQTLYPDQHIVASAININDTYQQTEVVSNVSQLNNKLNLDENSILHETNILHEVMIHDNLGNYINEHIDENQPKDVEHISIGDVMSWSENVVQPLIDKAATLEYAINCLNMDKTNLFNELNNVKCNTESRFRYLERTVASTQKESYTEIEYLKTQITSLEREITQFQQYNRRESIEISGFPEDISQNDLENIIIGILRRIGVWGLESYQITACHRLKRKVTGEKTQRVIIRFINRKHAHQSLLGRKYLKDTIWEFPGIYIHESLCHKYKDLFDKCMELKLCGYIKKIWTYNGIVNIKKTDNYNELPKRIFHQDDIDRYLLDLPG